MKTYKKNHMRDNMKRVLIDANPVVPDYLPGSHVSGVGRTCIELIKAINNLEDLPFEVMLYSQNLKGIGGRNLNTHFKTRHCYIRNNDACNRLSAQIRIREFLTQYDLMHITHNYEIVAHPERCIVTLHDAFFMRINETQFNHLNMRKVAPPFIQKCKHVITCSEYSKHDIIETMGINPDKITVIPWGIDHNTFYAEELKEEVQEKLELLFDIKRPYYLSVSCNAERKRTDKLIEAYIDYIKEFGEPSNDLILVWNNPPSNVLSAINNAGQRAVSHIKFLSNVSNDELRYLYNGATASFTPSAYEGFGLPLLEAMACGCPVVSANNSSLPEVGGDVAIYLDEPIIPSLKKIIGQFENGEIDRIELKNKGVERAKLFTWERAAKETVKVYERALQNIGQP